MRECQWQKASEQLPPDGVICWGYDGHRLLIGPAFVDTGDSLWLCASDLEMSNVYVPHEMLWWQAIPVPDVPGPDRVLYV